MQSQYVGASNPSYHHRPPPPSQTGQSFDLISAVRWYRDPERTYADIDVLLQIYPALSPSTVTMPSSAQQNFSVPSSTSPPPVQLILIRGTLPVDYQKATFNIPVDILLFPEYPQAPPRARVVIPPGQEQSMQLNATNDVQLENTPPPSHQTMSALFIGHLKQQQHQWDPQTMNLVELVGLMQASFAREMPVYAISKPAQSTTPIMAFSQQQPPATTSTRPTPLSTAAIKDELIRAVKVKIDDRLKARLTEINQETDALIEDSSILTKHTEQLESVKETLSRHLDLLKTLKKSVQEAKERAKMPQVDIVDNKDIKEGLIITPQGTAQSQLLDMAIKAQVLADSIYALSKAFLHPLVQMDKRGEGVSTVLTVVTVPEYVKHVREMAREQFMARAVMRKLQAKIQQQA